MKRLSKLLCRLFWHRYDPIAAEYYHIYHCDRCGGDHQFEPGLLPRMAWRACLRLQDAWWSFRHWWRCVDCGRYCGRHDDSVDHLPF